ncbi:PadR family transcriptional regulator, partial [Vibrio anguillarum]|nr:PadR family transcriptional regulator [Vibrio anguillarum]
MEHEQGTGYELTKLMSNSRIWRASHQQIYKSLKKLAKNGILVCKHEPQEGKPDRKVYSLTSEGINQFNKAVENINPSMKSLHSIRTVMLN